MKTNTSTIYTVLKIVFWIILIGHLIQTGSIIINYFISVFNPNVSNNTFLGDSSSNLNELGLRHYTSYLSFQIAILLSKAYMAYLAIKIFDKINLANPFSETVANLIVNISHTALGAGVIAIIAQGHTQWLAKQGFDVMKEWNGGQFLFLAGIIFIIAQIFKRGIELQQENELTI